MGAMALTSCGTIMTAGTGTVYTDDDYGYDPYDGGYTTYDGSYGSYGPYDAGYNAGYASGYTAAAALDLNQASRQALFLSDKMAYELGLTDLQYQAVYEINLDYLLNLTNDNNLFGSYWIRRNSDLFYVLDATQYNMYISQDYFYRPVYWYDNAWSWRIYNRYADRDYFYRARPSVYYSYRGGHNRGNHSWYADNDFGRNKPSAAVTNRRGGGNWHFGNGNPPAGNAKQDVFGTAPNRGTTVSQGNRSFGGSQTGVNRGNNGNANGGKTGSFGGRGTQTYGGNKGTTLNRRPTGSGVNRSVTVNSNSLPQGEKVYRNTPAGKVKTTRNSSFGTGQPAQRPTTTQPSARPNRGTAPTVSPNRGMPTTVTPQQARPSTPRFGNGNRMTAAPAPQTRSVQPAQSGSGSHNRSYSPPSGQNHGQLKKVTR